MAGFRHAASLFFVTIVACACAQGTGAGRDPSPEVRAVWLTTTANDHIATSADTARTMRRLRELGLNTVYVEAWKNGYTQYPSDVLKRTIGVDRKPSLIEQDPSRTPGAPPRPPRDLLGEAVTEAHRNGLLCVAWFEYGFMAAHKDTDNHLRRMKCDWLSLDRAGNEVAPNGFVWMNPLHPGPRRFLLDIVLEAIDRYDLDGVQLDDRIVWPYVTMGYDEYTRSVYAEEHAGRQPPEDPYDPDWMRWRADKVNEYARRFVRDIRRARPGIIVSLSPAPYPWCYEHYLLEWPEWATWEPGNADRVWWDEFIPQCYRYDFAAFRDTWDQQIANLHTFGAADRIPHMLAGILTTGSRPQPVPWADLHKAVEHVRATGGGGHVWWFSRGVLDEYPEEIAGFYDVARTGRVPHPHRPPDWRPRSVRIGGPPVRDADQLLYRVDPDVRPGTYRVIALRNGRWSEVGLDGPLVIAPLPRADALAPRNVRLPSWPDGEEPAAIEILVDRRPEMSTWTPGSP
jgi:uncharacterized lipoprotein YddW (UPF0748 family)